MSDTPFVIKPTIARVQIPVKEQETEPQPEPQQEQQWYSEPIAHDVPSGVLTMQGGVNGYNGKTETWYSSNVAPHKDMAAWTLRGDGVWTDADGYVIIASSDMPFGTEHETSLGMGKVYDTGCASGVVDVYVAW